MRTAGLIAFRAGSDVIGKAAFFAITVLAARRLSSYDFGVFAIGTTIGWFVLVASDAGLQMHLARSVAREPGSAGFFLRRWLRVRLVLTAAGLLAVAAALALFEIRPAPALFLFAAGYAAAGMVEFLHYFYRGLSRTDIESMLTIWQRVATLACAAAVLWLRPTPAWLAAAMLVAPLVTAVYSLRLARALAGPAARVRAGVSWRREFFRDVAPIGGGILLSALYFRIDVFLLQWWSGTETVGLYNAAFRLIEALRLFPAAVLAVMLPTLVRATTHRPLAHTALLLGGASAAVAATLWLAADWLMPFVFGPSFAAAAPAFRVLAAAFPLMAINYALTQQLIGWDGHRSYALLCLTALVVNVGLNARLIPAMSLTGAAWSTLLTEVVLTAGCLAALAILARSKPSTGASSTEAMAAI
jgi:O-antigen/teichoic acid export membrane protein